MVGRKTDEAAARPADIRTKAIMPFSGHVIASRLLKCKYVFMMPGSRIVQAITVKQKLIMIQTTSTSCLLVGLLFFPIDFLDYLDNQGIVTIKRTVDIIALSTRVIR